ncbi:MAG: NAD(P)-dependent oxidoreductase [Solirubrobacterales bacterium]|nr:NAD(P)-dependent oxidoreductase [Solirubrobacterales bacterium]
MESARSVLVAGGAGYVGSVLVGRLLEAGQRVTVLDALLYDNGASLAGVADHAGFTFVRADIRDREAVEGALDGVDDVVLLAALVGDPVCSSLPELAREVNVDGAGNVLDAAVTAGVERLVFASTCSNYGLRDSDEPATEADQLNPLSLYAETKVEMEHRILERAPEIGAATVLRVATAFGISPRMRFDLTVSEFTRELTLGRELEVYDAETWRPYCHVSDIASAIQATLAAPADTVGGEVFNAGGADGNFTKRGIVEAALSRLGERGAVKWAEGGVDPRNYRVSFDKIIAALGFVPEVSVPAAIASLSAAIDAGLFTDVERRPSFFANNQGMPGVVEGRAA